MNFDSIMPSHLSYFSVVYKCRSYAEAARMIPMTLKGVKKAIHRLECDIGFELFTSDEASLIPTAYADELYAMVRSWYSDISELNRNLNRLRAGDHVTLSLGAALGIPGFLGIDFAYSFQKLHPNITVQVTELGDYRVDSALIDREFDLALTVAPFNDAFETRVLYEEPIVMWINLDDPLSKKDLIDISDLDGRVLGMIDRTCKAYMALTEEIANAGVRPACIVTSGEIFMLQRFAREGRGLGTGVKHLARELDGSGSVAAVPIRDMFWRIGVSYPKGHQLTPEEQMLVDFLETTARDRAAL